MTRFSKNIARPALLLLLILAFSCFLCSCQAKENDTKGTMTVFIQNGENEPLSYAVPLDKVEITEGAFSVLDYLKNEKNVSYTASDGTFGKFLTQVGNLDASAVPGGYISLYTNVAEDMDVSAWAKTLTVGGYSVTTSGVGISLMTVKDGGVLYVALETYN
ncbi:MAG: hypothetical protein MJ078_01100 [Clostridia bacterium]|nr:hypothetical protein [Clostridia bacterium]